MDRKDFLLEYFKSSQNETLTRVKWRDSWLKIQLIVLVALAALSSKINFIIESSTERPELLFLALPISIIICSLYFVEDNIIGKLSNYTAATSEAESILSSDSKILLNWDNSEQLKSYLSDILPKRVLAQYIAFFIIPFIYCIIAAIVFIPRLCQNSFSITIFVIAIALNVIASMFVIYIIHSGNNLRKEARDINPISILKKKTES